MTTPKLTLPPKGEPLPETVHPCRKCGGQPQVYASHSRGPVVRCCKCDPEWVLKEEWQEFNAPLPVSGESKLPTVKLVAETSVVFDGSGNRVCLVRNRAMTNAATDALAKLFAASPDLLDSLNALVRVLAGSPADSLEEFIAARAAIEKATK